MLRLASLWQKLFVNRDIDILVFAAAGFYPDRAVAELDGRNGGCFAVAGGSDGGHFAAA